MEIERTRRDHTWQRLDMEEEKGHKKNHSSQRESRGEEDCKKDKDLIDKTRDSLDNLPELRQEKIDVVKKRILSGYYDTPEARELLVTKLIHFLKKRLP